MVYYLVRVKGELWNKTVRIMVKTSHQFRWLSGKFCASTQSDYTRWAWACFSAKTIENVSIKIEFNIPVGLVGDTNMDIFPLLGDRGVTWKHYSWFSCDVTAAILVYRTTAKKVFWDFADIIMQNLSEILPLFCTPTWPSHHVSENQELQISE